MKTVVHHGKSRDNLLHVETDGCIVNITVGLSDSHGRKVTSIEMIPDQYVGDEWHRIGLGNTRVIEGKTHEPDDEYHVLALTDAEHALLRDLLRAFRASDTAESPSTQFRAEQVRTDLLRKLGER